MMSPWTSRYLEERNHRVIVANSRKLRAIYKNPRKCDRKDAEMLARLARVDETLLGPIKHGSEEAQRDLAIEAAGQSRATTGEHHQQRSLLS